MFAQSPEVDWLERLEEWADQCMALAASTETRDDQSDTGEESADWQERFREISQLASEAREQLAAEEIADMETDMIALDTKARELDAAVRPLIEGEPDHYIAEAPEDTAEDGREDAQTTEDDQLQESDADRASDQPHEAIVQDDRGSGRFSEEVAVNVDSDEFDEATDADDRKSDKTHVVPIGQHTLPPLPYAYDALEPDISAEIMRLHHQVHHQGYVDGLNKAEQEMQEARRTGKFEVIRHWEDEAAFNGAGHYLHTIFWHSMSPNGGGEPSGAIAQEIKQTFGSFAQFKEHFTHAADKVQGPGWAMLVWSPRSRRTEILQAEKHQNLSQQDIIPLLVLDVWEHAYYLQYHAKRRDYIDAWWNIVCWDNVNQRFEKARNVMWQPS